MYKRIQEAGKLLQVGGKYEEVEVLLQELDPRGVLIQTSAPSVEAADELLRNAEQWSRPRAASSSLGAFAGE